MSIKYTGNNTLSYFLNKIKTHIDEIKNKIPTKISELENDSNYAIVEDIPVNVSELNNDAEYASETYVNETVENKDFFDIANNPYLPLSSIGTVNGSIFTIDLNEYIANHEVDSILHFVNDTNCIQFLITQNNVSKRFLGTGNLTIRYTVYENEYSINIKDSDHGEIYIETIDGVTEINSAQYQFVKKGYLENYSYSKSETYSQEEVNSLVSSIPKFSIQPVDVLPTENISDTTVYLLTTGDESQNLYTEYIYVDNVWEKLGTQTLDLSGYETTENAVAKLDEAKSYTDTQITDFSDNIDQLVLGLYDDGKDLPMDGTAPSIRDIANDEATTLIDEVNNELSRDIKNKQFYITVSGNDTDGYTMDMSFEKLIEAYNDGKILYCGVEYDGMQILCPLMTNNSTEMFIFATTADGLSFACVITNEGVMVDVREMALKSDIPVVDTELNVSSNNAISNKAVSEKFADMDKPINWLGDDEDYNPLEEKIINKPFYSSFKSNNNIYSQRLTFENGECIPTQVPELIIGNTYRVSIGMAKTTILELCTATAFTMQGVQVAIQLNFGYGYMMVVHDEYVDEIGVSCLIVLKDNSVNETIRVNIYDTTETVHKLDKKYLPKELDAAMDAFVQESKEVEVLGLGTNIANNYKIDISGDGSLYYYWVSDSTYAIEELSGGVTVSYNYNGESIDVTFAQDELLEGSDMIMGTDADTDIAFMMTLSDNVNIEGITFEKKGVYLFGTSEVIPSSIQVHGHTINGLGTVVKDDYLPSDVVMAGEIVESCFENVGIEVDITWDGDTTGKDVFDKYYHVSDVVPSKSDLLKGGKIVLTSIEDGTSVEREIASDKIEENWMDLDSIIGIKDIKNSSSNLNITAVLIVPYDNYAITNVNDEITYTIKNKGIYLYKDSDYVSLLDINDFKLPFYKLKPEHVDLSEDIINKQFYINMTAQNDDGTVVLDKTFAEIEEAYNEGKILYVVYTEDVFRINIPLLMASQSIAYSFSGFIGEMQVSVDVTPDSATLSNVYFAMENQLSNYYLKTEADALHDDLHDYVDTEVAALVNSAPETLDTLGELATAFNENKEVVEALDNAITTKANQSDLTALSNTVDSHTTKLNSINEETWTFTLDDGSTVTKKVAIFS